MDEGDWTLSINDVVDLLKEKYAIITGGRNGEGCPIITFPDTGTFYTLLDEDYRKLMAYLTSIPPLQDSDLGFVLVIDRRNDKWSAVRTVLMKIAGYFPGLIHGVFVVRPLGLLQKAISEVSNKLFKEEFKFKVVICSHLKELHQCVDPDQLTEDLGGSVHYLHEEWVEQRMAVEKFSLNLQDISRALREMSLQFQEAELPNDVPSTLRLYENHGESYQELKEDLRCATHEGETLLNCIRKPSAQHYPGRLITVAAVQRLLVQLDETEKGFDSFWHEHEKKLSQCLELRGFEEQFKDVQRVLTKHLEELNGLPTTGNCLTELDAALLHTRTFQQAVQPALDKIDHLRKVGGRLLDTGEDSVAPKCEELDKIEQDLRAGVSHKLAALYAQRDLHTRIHKANKWCSRGVELLAKQHLTEGDVLAQLDEFLAGADQFCFDDIKDDTILIDQVLKRVDDVRTMCSQRRTTLAQRPPVPLAPEKILRKAKTVPKIEMSLKRERPHMGENVSEPTSPQSSEEVFQLKRKHVMTELIETERTYVSELSSIIQGYKKELENPVKKHLVPPSLLGKSHVLFGNLEELHAFHSRVFLKELVTAQMALSPSEVGRCFVERREPFHKLYSTYCLNKPKSEALRLQCSDDNPFFKDCQMCLGHKLPLGAYLLKPVQRITKYQLLLKDLLKTDQTTELQGALDTMLAVLKFVNDCMHQVAITGFHGNLADYGQLLLQGSFSVWMEKKKKDRIRELRFKPCQRYIFLYEHLILFTKKCGREDNFSYAFKNALKTSQIGLTETVRGSRGDKRKFEVWLHGRTQVFIIQAPTLEVKENWLREIKKVLIQQFELLKGQSLKQYSDRVAVNEGRSPSPPTYHRLSWDASSTTTNNNNLRFAKRVYSEAHQDDGWSTDELSQTEDEEEEDDIFVTPVTQSTHRHVVLGDYDAVDVGEATLREGQTVEVRKIGSAGWWFVKVLESGSQGWAPASYLGPSSPSVSSQDSGSLHHAVSRTSVASSASLDSAVI